MNYISLFFLNFLNFHDDYLLICYWILIPRNNQSIELFVLFGLYIYIYNTYKMEITTYCFSREKLLQNVKIYKMKV